MKTYTGYVWIIMKKQKKKAKQEKKVKKQKKPKKEKIIEEPKDTAKKLNDITKKLQRLVENRKTPRVVSRQDSYKPGSRGSRVSSGGDYYGGSEDEY